MAVTAQERAQRIPMLALAAVLAVTGVGTVVSGDTDGWALVLIAAGYALSFGGPRVPPVQVIWRLRRPYYSLAVVVLDRVLLLGAVVVAVLMITRLGSEDEPRVVWFAAGTGLLAGAETLLARIAPRRSLSGAGRRSTVPGMAYTFQVTVDCSDPHALADWWAETLGWDVEPSDEAFIRRMVDGGYARGDDTTTHHGTLVWRTGQAILAPDPGPPRVLFQLVPESKTVKNRLHLDVRIGEDDLEATVARLAGRGAQELHRGRQGPHEWVTMSDPEGNEFCVSR